jgi:uncharacterized Zn ribbon protein
MTVRDSNGNELKDGDAVLVIKDLKVTDASDTLKPGRSRPGDIILHNIHYAYFDQGLLPAKRSPRWRER